MFQFHPDFPFTRNYVSPVSKVAAVVASSFISCINYQVPTMVPACVSERKAGAVALRRIIFSSEMSEHHHHDSLMMMVVVKRWSLTRTMEGLR